MSWISVKDRMPSDTEDVLITDGARISTGWFDDHWTDDHGYGDYDSDFIFYCELVTHWAPLPPLPIATKDAS